MTTPSTAFLGKNLKNFELLDEAFQPVPISEPTVIWLLFDIDDDRTSNFGNASLFAKGSNSSKQLQCLCNCRVVLDQLSTLNQLELRTVNYGPEADFRKWYKCRIEQEQILFTQRKMDGM
ncbi:hypothetical protein BV898_14432 [Hypsibius exemplaris]|uniref:Uncharacterized protein n=1 Tax=Hypsibius exemplaris TaxID=2072580 RepID=A0A9X6RJF0_HYPEX|nr:hypothetical protein BV898_14432 [Hypsibius exemplaris]